MSHPSAGAPVEVPAGECLTRDALAATNPRRSPLAGTSRAQHVLSARFAAAGIGRGEKLGLEDLRACRHDKADLCADQDAHAPWGSNLTFPRHRYTRFCQTSSTTGRPLKWCDTNETWQWMLECWKAVYRAARVGPGDRVLFPFSFGPFLGFWAAFDAAPQIGAMAIPAGGMASHLRLAMMDSVHPDVVCCTPTYGLRLAEVAAADHGDGWLAARAPRVVIVAGEPGGSIPSTRRRIEASWGTRVIDHHGLTETGPASFECWERPGGLHLLENEFVVEVVEPSTGKPPPRRLATGAHHLGRSAPGHPHRTWDLSRAARPASAAGRCRGSGGSVRADDMVTGRRQCVSPAGNESVLRHFPAIVEFRSTVRTVGSMRTLDVEVEVSGAEADATAVATQVGWEIREALGLTVPVHAVPSGHLPRFEMKARRFIVEPAAELSP